MSKCKYCKGDRCTYEDYASGRSEDGYCLVVEKIIKSSKCDTYRKK